jgi:hypothetical protein
MKNKKTKKLRKPRPKVKVRKWHDALEKRRSDAVYADLARAYTKPRTADKRKSVPVSEIVVAEKVFQWRGLHSDIQAEERQMRELIRVLDLGRELEPILVLTIGKKVYVVDGHHRLAAYVTVGRKTIPVEHFSGGLEAAWHRSLEANIRDKLPMTRQDKYEAAFTLVKHKVARDQDTPCEELAVRAGVGPRVVYKMQSELRKALVDDKDASKLRWTQMLRNMEERTARGRGGDDDFRDEWARRLADQIMAKVGTNLTANPDITAMALRMISEQLPRALIEEWMEEVVDALIQQARDCDSEDAERALKQAFECLSKARDAREGAAALSF